MRNTIMRMLVVATFLLLVGAAVAAGRKKPPDVYIRTAKIEVVSGDPTRYPNAESFLDTLFLYYGPHPEGYYWMRKIMTDYVENTGGLKQKGEYVRRMVAYNDSLHFACDSKDVKKKYKKKCKKFIQEGDSTMVLYWRKFYNEGVRQLKDIDQVTKDAASSSSDEEKQYFDNRLQALVDTCEFNMTMAVAIDETDPQPYIGLSSIFRSKKDYTTANDWLIKALDKTNSRAALVQDIAYNYVNQDKYCEAIPYLKEYVDSLDVTDEHTRRSVLSTMYNLSICYTRCEKYDEAAGVYEQILAVDSNHIKALSGLARYHSDLARFAADSANQYQKDKDDASVTTWRSKRDAEFDSALVFLQRVYDLQPDDARTAEEYGIISYVRMKYQQAAEAFERVSRLEPENIDNWISLGDTYINLKEFAKSTSAYEKVAEARPQDRQILEQLRDLYIETKQPAKRKAIEKKLKAL